MESLIDAKARELGYKIRKGDLFRDPRVFGDMGISKGYGHPNSCHKLKLAIDINLIDSNGKLVEDDRGHKELHDWWDAIGGAKRILNDINHYSIEHNGFR